MGIHSLENQTGSAIRGKNASAAQNRGSTGAVFPADPAVDLYSDPYQERYLQGPPGGILQNLFLSLCHGLSNIFAFGKVLGDWAVVKAEVGI